MNRIPLILLLLSACFAGCKKTNDAAAVIKAQQAIDDKVINNYLQTNNLTAKVIDSAGVSTSIYYIIDTLGSGNDLFTSSTVVTVGYTAKVLKTGLTVDSTSNFHPSFVLGEVIRGWFYGIPKIKKGGTVRLFVPSRYAYGPFPQPRIPANSVLFFNIKLYNVTN